MTNTPKTAPSMRTMSDGSGSRENQIERVVEHLTDLFWEDTPDEDREWHAMGWDRYYDLTIYPIENDLYKSETDWQIQVVLGEPPHPVLEVKDEH